MKKREILEMKMKEAANGPSKLMTLLEKHQNKTGEAHLIIQLGSKNKQEWDLLSMGQQNKRFHWFNIL